MFNEYVANVLRAALEARATLSPATFIEYTNWYYGAHRWCNQQSANCWLPTGGLITGQHVAAITALLSPQNRWTTNKADAQRYLAAAVKAAAAESWSDQPPDAATYDANRRKAWAYLRAVVVEGDVDTPRLVTGDKVSRFYQTLANPYTTTDRVVIDRWALRIAGFKLPNLTPKRYLEVEEAYIRATRLFNEATGHELVPHQVQALTWCSVRKGAE